MPHINQCSCCTYFEKEIEKHKQEEILPLNFTAITKLDEPVINPENNEPVYYGQLSIEINYCLHCGRKLKTEV